jgi:hypothetical protein
VQLMQRTMGVARQHLQDGEGAIIRGSGPARKLLATRLTTPLPASESLMVLRGRYAF